MSLIHHRLVNIFSQQKTMPGDETLEEMTNIQLLHIRMSVNIAIKTKMTLNRDVRKQTSNFNPFIPPLFLSTLNMDIS